MPSRLLVYRSLPNKTSQMFDTISDAKESYPADTLT